MPSVPSVITATILIRALQALQILEIRPIKLSTLLWCPVLFLRGREGSSLSNLLCDYLVVPRMEKTGSECYGGYAWAEESLLPGGTSPVIISNDDDDLV